MSDEPGCIWPRLCFCGPCERFYAKLRERFGGWRVRGGEPWTFFDVVPSFVSNDVSADDAGNLYPLPRAHAVRIRFAPEPLS